jgi:DNA-binding MarR family transcriptional regulator
VTNEHFDDDDYKALHEFRYAIRRFVRYSEEVSRAAGLEPQQQQLMLAVRACGTAGVSELAERMQLRHHSTVELIDRLVSHGYATRHRGEVDRRQVLVHLTPEGEELLREVSIKNLAQLRSEAPGLLSALRDIARTAQAAAR